MCLYGGDLVPKLYLKSKDVNIGEDRDDKKLGKTSIDLASTPPSLNGNWFKKNQISYHRQPSSSWNAL